MVLAEGADSYRLLVESLEELALALLDEDGRVRYWSPGAQRVTGYAASDIVGHGLERLWLRDDAGLSNHEATLERARREGVAHVHGWRMRKDGERFYGEAIMRRVFDAGEPAGFAWVLRDRTTEKKAYDRQHFLAQAGAVLTESLDAEDTFARVCRLLVPEIADWGLVYVLRGEELERLAFAHVDPARERIALRLTGTLPPLRDLERGVWGVIDSGQSRLVPHISPDYIDEMPVPEEQRELLRMLGFSSWMCVPLTAHGQVLGALSLVMAESGRIFDEGDLVFAEEVGRRAGRTLENARLYEDARRALLAREEFLAVASHELRTPLTPLRLQLDALARALTSQEMSPARQLQRLKAMRRQVDRLARLVESLLAVTRGSPIELHAREPADLVDIVADAVDRMRERADASHTELVFTPREPVSGRFDVRAVEIILEHLLDNALKYGEGAPVEVTVERQGAKGIVRVRDRGIGIEESDHERIFRKFERSVSADHYGGLGLGLFLANELALAHGGALRVESARAQGAMFIVELPLDEAGRAQSFRETHA